MKIIHLSSRWYIIVILISLSHSAVSQVRVNGYYRKDGTYVRPHYRSSPDGNPYNNYSYPGNANPYTGKVATGNPSTYLANYYKTYPYSHSESTYNNYTRLLTGTNYRGMGLDGNTSYSVSDGGIVIGRMQYYKERAYKIYDQNLNHIGYVKLNKNRRKYAVYDLYNYRVSSNRNTLSGGGDGYLYALLMLGLVAVIMGTE